VRHLTELFIPIQQDQINEVKREIAIRQRVYPRWVADGKLTQAKADRQIEVMQAVLATLEPVG
jgi:hypothetical protein